MKTSLPGLLILLLFMATGCSNTTSKNTVLDKIWYNPMDKTFIYFDSEENQWYQWYEWNTDNNGNRYDIHEWPTAIPDSLPYLYKHTFGRGWEEIGRFKYSQDTLIILEDDYDTLRRSVNLITGFGDTSIAEEEFLYVKKVGEEKKSIWLTKS